MFYLEQKLAGIGIDGKKAKLYLAALEMGDASVHEIAKRAGIGRTSAYDVLARLKNDGLVTQYASRGRIHVVAEPPEQLFKRFEARLQRLGELIPDLRALHNVSPARPRFKLYEGEAGIRTVLQGTLQGGAKVIRACLSMVEILETPGFDEVEKFSCDRIAGGIELRVIRAKPEEVSKIWGSDASKLRELRYAPSLACFAMTTFIHGDKVSLISSSRENFGLVIQSAEFATMQQYLFEVLWQASERSAEGDGQ
jgi:sugar-specific transcriptional regulator TrmB